MIFVRQRRRFSLLTFSYVTFFLHCRHVDSFKRWQRDITVIVTPGLNFTNILRAAFLYKSAFWSFYLLTVWVCNFFQKKIGSKAARKMSVKLTTGQEDCYFLPNVTKSSDFEINYEVRRHNLILVTFFAFYRPSHMWHLMTLIWHPFSCEVQFCGPIEVSVLHQIIFIEKSPPD